MALDAALHIAAGRSWAGRKVRQGGVVYVASEAGRGTRKRIVAALRHHEMVSSLPFALLTVAPDLGQRDSDADVLANDILAQIPDSFDPKLIVLDTLARSMVGSDESGSAGMGLFVENAGRLGRTLGAAVLAVHHMGKDRLRGMRGSSALLGAIDALWEIDPEDPGTVRIAKMKDDADNLAVPFSLTRVVVDDDADGDPITTCIVTTGLVKTTSLREGAENTVRNKDQEGGDKPEGEEITSSTEAFLVAFKNSSTDMVASIAARNTSLQTSGR